MAAAIGAIGVVGWLAAWQWLPGAMRPRVEQVLAETLGRRVQVESVEASASLLRWRVTGLTVGARGAGEPALFEVGVVEVGLSLGSLPRRAVVLERLHLDRPRLRLRRQPDGQVDVEDIMQRLQSRPNAPGAEPARFELHDLSVAGGQVLLRDDRAAVSHRVDRLQVALPLVSNLAEHRDVAAEPRVSFNLDGAAVELSASILPFQERPRARVTLRVGDLDLTPWLAHWPRDLEVRPVQGRLALNLTADAEASGGALQGLAIAGRLEVRDLGLADAAGVTRVRWGRLGVDIADLQPLARRLRLDAVRLDQLSVDAARGADGRLEGLPALPPAAAGGTREPPPWRLELARLTVNEAAVRWRDAGTRPAAELQLADMAIEGTALRWPADAPQRLNLAATVASGSGGASAGRAPAARLTGLLEGQADRWTLKARADGLRLEWAAPYLAAYTPASVAGRLSLESEVEWMGGAPNRVRVPRLQADELAVGLPSASPVRVAGVRSLQLGSVEVDPGTRRVTLGQLRLLGPSLDLARTAGGAWNLDGLRRPGPASPSPQPGAAWSLAVRDLSLSDGRLRYRDAAVSGPVALSLSAMRLRVQDLQWPLRAGAAGRVEAGLALATEGPGASQGRLALAGRWTGMPLGLQARTEVDQMPLAWAAAYAPDAGPFRLADARLRFRGEMAASSGADGWGWRVSGDAAVTDLDLRSAGSEAFAGELLNWQALSARALQAEHRPGQTLSVSVDEVTLNDFYARLLVDEKGRLNLMAAEPAVALNGSAAGERPVMPATSDAAAPADKSAEPGSAGPGLRLTVGRTRVDNGRVDFTDRFIRPNYSAALSELNGSLGRFSSDAPDLAALELRGRVAGTAQLEIAGALHPMTRPPSLDLRARATDLELAPLSPYAAKYAGYGIERGKLSMDVRYRIDTDGKLEASNRIVLNQLTFGDRVDSPDATQLPVLLAVALLKDRHGVIDIDLPIGGSLSDPQFSVGGLIVKVIVNLLTKALLAPFSLLGGGGPEGGELAFEAGTARLADGATDQLARVAQSLQDRPALQLTITAQASEDAERQALQGSIFEAQLQAAWRRQQLRSAAGAVADAAVTLPTPAQREVLLRQWYREASHLPNRPRNALGLVRDLPVAETEAALRGAIVVDAAAVRELALQRAVAVRDALVARGLPASRLFLAAPRLVPATEPNPARALLSLGLP